MNVAVIVATFGDSSWERCALAASASATGAVEVLCWHEPNGTLATARNNAADNSVGDWLCFLDADDELAPGYLAAMKTAGGLLDPAGRYLLVPAIEYVCEECGGTGRRATARSANGRELDRHERSGTRCDVCEGRSAWPPAIPAWDRSLIDLNCAVIGTLIPRSLFDEVGGFRELPALEDWEMFLRCVEAGAKMVPVPSAVYRAAVCEGSRNTDQSSYHRIRAEHRARFDWGDVGSYKIGEGSRS